MSSCYVIPKKPFLYKIKARIFYHLRLCAMIVENERYMKVLESNKIYGFKSLWMSLDEL